MFHDSFVSALKSIWANKMRSFLTILGIVIGIYAVVTLLAAAEGVQNQISSSIEDFGPKTIIVLPGEETEDGVPNITGSFAPSTIFTSDVTYLQENATLIETDNIDYATFIGGLISKGETKVMGLPVGITPGVEEFLSAKVSKGRSITQDDLDNKSRVILISENSAEKLKVGLGDEINVGPNVFEIVGLFTIEQQLNLTSSTGDMFLFPAPLGNEINKSEQISRIMVYAKEIDQVDQARQEIRELLSKKHGTKDFTVLKPTDVLDTVGQITDVLKYMVAGIASISLLVGGIGIMNIMLVTVAERTREIGIRKAVGATEGAILTQFLIESVVLTLLGAVIGIGLATLTSLLAAKFSPLEPAITGQTIILAVGMGLVAGVVFGLLPAIRAARKNPVDALRFE